MRTIPLARQVFGPNRLAAVAFLVAFAAYWALWWSIARVLVLFGLLYLPALVPPRGAPRARPAVRWLGTAALLAAALWGVLQLVELAAGGPSILHWSAGGDLGSGLAALAVIVAVLAVAAGGWYSTLSAVRTFASRRRAGWWLTGAFFATTVVFAPWFFHRNLAVELGQPLLLAAALGAFSFPVFLAVALAYIPPPAARSDVPAASPP